MQYWTAFHRLVSDVIQRLNLRGQPFDLLIAASVKSKWSCLQKIDSSLKFGEKYQKALSLHASLSLTSIVNKGTIPFV